MDVGIFGWNGKFNVGDDAMTQVMVEHFKQLDENANIKLLAEQSRLPDFNHSVKAYSGYEKINNTPFVHRIFNPMLYLPDFTNVDHLIFGGGSIFHSSKNTNFFGRIAQKAKKKRNAKCGAIAVSVGPWRHEGADEANRRFLESMDYVVVRDNKSMEILKNWDLQTNYAQGVDIAVLYPKYFQLNLPKKENRIGISLRKGFASPEIMQKFADVLTQVGKTNPGLEILIYAFCENETDGDVEISEQLKGLISEDINVNIYPYSRNTTSFYESLGSCKLVIATRLHAAILSYTVNTSFMVMSYHEKCKEFARYVQLDDKYVFDVNSFEPEALANNINDVLVDEQFSDRLLPLVEAQESAMNHFKFI